MKSNKRFIVLITALGILITISMINITNLSETSINKNNDSEHSNEIYLKYSNFWDNFTFIHITGANWSNAANYEWCSGSGIWGDPYRLENITIDRGGGMDGSGIIIENSNYYCVIENCTLYNSGSNFYDAGIRLISSSNCRLIDNNCSFNNNAGIYMRWSENNTLIGNIANDNRQPGGNRGTGIHIQNSNNMTISGNIVNNNLEGGIQLENSENITISENNMTRCGVVLSGTTHNITLDNLINGKKLYYYKNQVNLGPSDFTDAGQIILVNCNDSLISNLNISYASYGLTLEYCMNNTISSNLASKNSQAAIKLNWCVNNTIYNNTILAQEYYYNRKGEQGVVLYNGYNNTISNNTIKHTEFEAISIYNSQNITILKNTLEDSGEGIDLDDIYNSTILENDLTHNIVGIMVNMDCDNNTIKNNTITDHTNRGLFIQPNSESNLVYLNKFIGNVKHAEDWGSYNRWDNGSIGNYWDNYTGVDVADDGIGDTPYNFIFGPAGSQDNYPIWHDAPDIFIDLPENGSEHGATAPSFTVRITDPNLLKMWYTLNSGTEKYNFTINGTINHVAWTALLQGQVTIRFYANDTVGNINWTEVIVIKKIVDSKDDDEDDDDETVLLIPGYNLYLLLSIICLTALILIKKRLSR